MEACHKFSVLELFSGIGGMRAALNETGQPFEVVGSFEINPTALRMYQHNFGKKINFRERNIMGLTTKMLEDFEPDVLVMSPPCQPFTRQGLKKDTKDSRCSPFLHVLSLLEKAHKIPRKILLENVAGFEDSEAHSRLLQVLKGRGYEYQEFLLTPSQFGVPNSRLRYYLIAKIRPGAYSFQTSEEIHRSFPLCSCYHSNPVPADQSKCSICSKPVHESVSRIIHERFTKCRSHTNVNSSSSLDEMKLDLSSYLEPLEDLTPYLIDQKTLIKYSTVFDIVSPSSTGSCCFTKGYAHYVQGTGSVIHQNRELDMDSVFQRMGGIESSDPRYAELVSSLRLRYFTPREVLRLMCFPDEFVIPESCSAKQAYKALGNSINVFLVSLLLIILME